MRVRTKPVKREHKSGYEPGKHEDAMCSSRMGRIVT